MSIGRFIVLEGIDGCGKSTQATRLVERLRGAGRAVVHTREPGGTRLGERVRALLLGKDLGEIDPRAEVFLYQAARAQIAAEVIRPALERGEVVVCERGHYATMAYQTAAHAAAAAGAPAAMVRETSSWATAGTEPDRAVLLDLEARSSSARMSRDLDRIESRGESYRAVVAATYRALFADDPDRLRVVPADGTIEVVETRVWEAVHDLFD
jgi:dTMP kinase